MRKRGSATTITALAVLAAMLLATAGHAQGDAMAAGKDVFSERCSVCHQASGKGIPGAFPPLAGNVPLFLQKGQEGRTTLEHIVLFGMQGQIQALGSTFDGAMPTWGPILSDQQIADVLTYVSHVWDDDAMLPDDFTSFTADEIAKARDAKLTPQQTHEEWSQLSF